MKKPYIICHMMTSVDGRIDCAMTEHLPGVQEYYDTLDSLNAPTRVSGRVTAELEMAGPRRISQRDRHSLRAGGLFQKDRCRRVRDHCGYKGHTAVGGAGG